MVLEKQTGFGKLKQSVREYNEKINWIVFALVCIYSWGNWIEILGIWAELPLMVLDLPESWRLPSVIVVCAQAGQIGSLSYLIINKLFPDRISFKFVIYTKMVLTLTCTMLLSFFWDSTAFIFGEQRSVGLFSLVFAIAVIDGFATLTAVPFIAKKFKKEYIVPYYIGETLMTVIPSVVAIAQGTGDDHGCHNVTSQVISFQNNSHTMYKDETHLEPVPLSPRFSVLVYFLILFGFLAMSAVSFFILNLKNRFKNARKVDEKVSAAEKAPLNSDLKSDQSEQDNKFSENFVEITYLWSLSFMLPLVIWGVLSGLQSYSTLPYGNDVFHMSINLASVFLPIATFLAVWTQNASLLQITIEFGITCFFSAYIVIISIQSPCPILLDSALGPIFIILSWFLSQSFFFRCRCFIASRLEQYGEKALMVSAALGILGEVIGGVIMYILIDVKRLFVERPECGFDKYSFCYSK